MGINVTDYRYLFDAMFGNNNKGKNMGMMKSSDLSTKSGQAQLRAAGIDTNSAQYKAAMKAMQSAGGVGNVNIQGIKNMMSSYDKDGDFVIQGGPFAGISGLVVNEENASKRTKGTVPISDSIKEEMFETLKKEFAEGKWDGVETSSGTNRADSYAKLQKGTAKNDRLAAGRTLQTYEKQYIKEFTQVLKAADPSRKPGMPASADAIAKLNEVSRSDIDKKVAAANGKVGNNINLSIQMNHVYYTYFIEGVFRNGHPFVNFAPYLHPPKRQMHPPKS